MPPSTAKAPAIRSRILAVVGIHVHATFTPHLGHTTVSGVVAAPHPGQKLLPLIGLAPQSGQISGFPTNSLPQFLQNIISPFTIYISQMEE